MINIITNTAFTALTFALLLPWLDVMGDRSLTYWAAMADWEAFKAAWLGILTGGAS